MSDDQPFIVDHMSDPRKTPGATSGDAIAQKPAESGVKPVDWPVELGGPKGPEPTRYGDWEQKGRCSDF